MATLLNRLLGRPTHQLPVWHHEAYRLPVDAVPEAVGIEPRRADLAWWGLQETCGRSRRRLKMYPPSQVSWDQLALVHTDAHLERLTHPRSLARMFGVDHADFPVDAVMTTVRLATGGTVAAARHVLAQGGHALNLLGGFHHAGPAHGGGLCPINDIAVAIAVARGDGFDGPVVVLDLDAHPPDGLAACLGEDHDVWIGSLSGSDWGVLPGVDETLLDHGCTDDTYLDALGALLSRMPRARLAFVIAGGDVLAGDRMGMLGMSEEGVRQRDQRVYEALQEVPTVWVPGGGYHADTWRVLAGTGLVLLGVPDRALVSLDNPMGAHYRRVARSLSREDLGAEELDGPLLTQAEVDMAFGARPSTSARLLGMYTAQGVEHALYAYGLLTQVRRLGYRDLDVSIDHVDTGDRFRLHGHADGATHLLVECIVRRERLEDRPVLYLEWLTLRHPGGSFNEDRPRLPGQDHPGLGLSWEAGELLERVARRLDLEAVVFRPAWFHSAWLARQRFAFVDAERQGRFEALWRDLAHLGLAEVTRLVHADQLRCCGELYAWSPEPMAAWLTPEPKRRSRRGRPVPPPPPPRPGLADWRARVDAAAEAAQFTVVEDPAPADP